MLPNEKRPSVIVEEEDILDPMVGYRNSLPEVEVTPTVVEFTEDEISPQYIAEEIEDADIIETVIDTEENHTEEDIAQNQQTSLQESSSDNNDEGIEVISEGAMCKCTMGKKPGNMNVVCQFKVYCNGGSKLVATTQERNLLSLSFGSCTAKNNAPCMPSISWQNYYEDVQIMRSLKILTMESKGVCQAGGGQIEFQTSGQSQSVSAKDITGVDRESLKSDNPLLRAEDEPIEIANSPAYEEMLREMEEKIRQEMERTMVILEDAAEIVRGKVDKNTGIVPVTYKVSKNNGVVKQPKGVVCSFLAAKKGVLTWKVRDDKMQIIHQADGAGTISIRFPKYGRYVIEAYGNSSTVKENTKVEDIEKKSSSYFNTLIIEVAPNEIILEASKEKWYVGGKVEIKATRLFEGLSLSVEGLRYHVAQSGAIAGSDKAEIANTGSGCIVTFKEKGSYVVTADRIGDIEVKPTAGIVIENLRVTSVTANNEKDLKTFKGETINVEAKLNYEEGDKEKIKWDIISPDGEKVNEGKPQPGDFQKPGTYKVYAYCSNARSESIKATIQINETKFLNINWVDGNNNPTKLIGARERVYARVGFEYSAGMEISAELRILGSDKVIETYPITKMQTNILVISVGPLSDTVCKSLQNNQQLYLYIKAKNGTAIKNKNAAPKSYPITYSTAKDIINLKFYIDKECRLPAIIGAYGSTIYAKVATRNLKQKEIQLKLIHDIDYAIDDTLGTFTTTLNDDGVGIFEIKVEDGWAKKNGYWQKTIKYYGVISEVGGDAYKEELTLGKDAVAITFTDKPKNSEEGKVLTKIGQSALGKSKTGKCPNCEKDITKEELKKIFWYEVTVKKGGKSVKEKVYPSDADLQTTVDTFNKYKVELGLNSCRNKAYFFAVAAVETGYKLQIKGGEDFNYYRGALIKTFGAFQTEEGKKKAEEWGRKVEKKTDDPANYKAVTPENQKKIANYAYGASCSTGKQLGNVNANDGWDYRGRGIIQLTGRSGYTYANTYTFKEGVNIISDPDKVGSNLKIGVLASMAFWKWKKISSHANKDDGTQVCKNVGRNVDSTNRYGQTSKNHTDKKRVYKEESSVVFKVSECQWGNTPSIPLNVTDIITYHIQSTGRKITKQIPKNNEYTEYRRFLYYDNAEKKHLIGDFKTIKIKKFIRLGRKSQKDIAPELKPDAEGMVEMTEFSQESFKGYKSSDEKVRAKIAAWEVTERANGKRVYINPECLAALLGAMLDYNIDFMAYRGSSDKTGDGNPSKSHVNGLKTDIAYFRKTKTTQQVLLHEKDFDIDLNIKFVNALIDYGYKTKSGFCTEKFIPYGESKVRFLVEGMTEIKDPPHNNHLHIGGFDFSTVIIKEK